MKRLTAIYWIPVVIELWPAGGGVTRITMVPQRPIFASKRYFRMGHCALDSLLAELQTAESASRAPSRR